MSQKLQADVNQLKLTVELLIARLEYLEKKDSKRKK